MATEATENHLGIPSTEFLVSDGRIPLCGIVQRDAIFLSPALCVCVKIVFL
jgi:hypothetical protein